MLTRRGVRYWDNMMERRKYDEGDNERDEDVHRLDFMIELYLVFDTRVFVRAL